MAGKPKKRGASAHIEAILYQSEPPERDIRRSKHALEGAPPDLPPVEADLARIHPRPGRWDSKTELRRVDPNARARHLARKAVYRALRSGRLEREACPCGRQDTEAHHPDYSRPLDVIWLCPKCHQVTHGGRPPRDLAKARPARVSPAAVKP